MRTLVEAVCGFVFAVVGLKCLAQLVHLVYVLMRGGAANTKLQEVSSEERQALADAFLKRSRPIDNLYEDNLPKPVAMLASSIFNQYSVVVIGTVATLWITSTPFSTTWLVVPLAVGTLAGAVLQLMVAFLRNLIFGARDSLFRDIRLPNRAIFKGWNALDSPGANLPIYFIVVATMLLLGFADMYAAYAARYPSDFVVQSNSGALVWIYFSASTALTVGYGDVHAQSMWAQGMVLAQMLSGPLLLSWLLAVFLSGDRDERLESDRK